MKQVFGMSKTGNLSEAIRGISNPKGLILFSSEKNFEVHVKELEQAFPGVPSIGCIAMSHSTSLCETGVSVTAFTEGVSVAAGVLENVSVKPAAQIKRLVDDIEKVKPGRENTVVIDLCSGNDAAVLTTVGGLLRKKGVCLMGGTGAPGKISANGVCYEDADVYIVVKNESGRARVYKENIYKPCEEEYRFVASKTDRSKYYIGELDGKPAKKVYMDTLGIGEADIESQTFKNPFGKVVGDDVRIVSIKEVAGNGLNCFRQVNDSDVLTLLELKDYRQVAQETMEKIKADFSRISAVFAVNCLFRYILFTDNKIWDDYHKTLAGLCNSYCGFVGYGEHINDQFVNQSMTCVVFE